MSVLGKSITALGAFEIVAGSVTSIMTGEFAPALAGVLLGSGTMAVGISQDCIDEEGAELEALTINAPEPEQP